MISIRTSLALAGTLILVSTNTLAKLDDFRDGTIIKGFGKYAPVATASVGKNTKMKVAFDVGAPADTGKVNRKFDSLARFINMQAAAGVQKENIQLALVVHGKASFDLLNNPSYQKLHKQDNPNQPLLQALMENGVRVILCGQTAAAYDIELSQLVNGSEVELSAMTAHALLQQDGYTVNPF